MLKLLAVFALAASPVLAQSTVEKGKAKVNDVKRQGRKTVHRVEEKTCTASKVECEKRKLKHRVDETGQKIEDEGEKVKDQLDSDGR